MDEMDLQERKPFLTQAEAYLDRNELRAVLNLAEDINGDGFLTPPNSAAGTVPETVITDANGVANFNLIYLKSSALSIVDRIRASTLPTSSVNETGLYMYNVPAGTLSNTLLTDSIKITEGAYYVDVPVEICVP